MPSLRITCVSHALSAAIIAAPAAAVSAHIRNALNSSRFMPGLPARGLFAHRRPRISIVGRLRAPPALATAAAQQWANTFADHPATRNKPMTPAEAAIITRYAPLFEPRRMVCRKCLRLRYGEAKGRRSRQDD